MVLNFINKLLRKFDHKSICCHLFAMRSHFPTQHLERDGAGGKTFHTYSKCQILS